MTDVYLDDYDPGAGVVGRWSLALAAALAKSTAQPPGYGFTVRLREQDYHLDQPLAIDRSTRLVAAGSAASTRLVCDGDGITVLYGGDLTALEGITLVGPGKATASVGVRLKSRASLRGVRVSGFGVGLMVSGAAETKANLWRMYDCEAVSCGTGFEVYGSDGNGGVATACSARDCDLGIYDHSFLGNAWIAPSLEACKIGGVWGASGSEAAGWSPVGNCVFGTVIAPYCEGDSPCIVAYPYMVVGSLTPHASQASMPTPTWLSTRGYEGQALVWAPDGGRVRVGGYPGFVLTHEAPADAQGHTPERLTFVRAADGTYTLGVGSLATSPSVQVGHGIGGGPRVFRMGEGGVPMTSWSSAPTWPMPDGSAWPIGSICWSTVATPRGWRWDGQTWGAF